jgi:organic radical activating enzyme
MAMCLRETIVYTGTAETQVQLIGKAGTKYQTLIIQRNEMNKGDKSKVNEDGTLESHFYIDAKEMQEKLNATSKSLCLAKWQQVSLHLTTGHTNSCYHPPLHKIPVDALKDNPAALHNTPTKIAARKQMLNGEFPSECSYCWNIEKDGNLSDRAYRSGEPWAAEHYNDIVGGEVSEVTPSYVEVNFNSNCNLACSYCSPQFSTAWAKEIKEHGAYPTTNPHNAPEHFEGDRKPILHREYNPYVEAFWKWWPELYPSLKHFRMTGGEPLMDKNTYKVFDYVLENPKPDLHLNVTSNFSVEPKLFDKYLDYTKRICADDNVEHFMQYVSVDTHGVQAEYLRHGLDFDLLLSNVYRFLSEVPSRNSVTFIITMNMLSIPNLQTLLDEILLLRKKFSTTYQRVWFDTPLLRQPEWMTLQMAPHSLRVKLESVKVWMQENLEKANEPFQGFKDYEVQRIQRDIDWMQNNPLERNDEIRRKTDFYKFFDAHDWRRKTEFLTAFPELRSFWLQCQQESNK